MCVCVVRIACTVHNVLHRRLLLHHHLRLLRYLSAPFYRHYRRCRYHLRHLHPSISAVKIILITTLSATCSGMVFQGSKFLVNFANLNLATNPYSRSDNCVLQFSSLAACTIQMHIRTDDNVENFLIYYTDLHFKITITVKKIYLVKA